MKPPLLLLFSFSLSLAPVPSALAGPAELRATVNALPARLAALEKANADGFAGSTMAMVEAASAVSEGLLPLLIALEADGKDGKFKKELEAEIHRDMAGIGSAVYHRNHAHGWGGTITTVEMAASQLSYLEDRICYNVTQLYKDDKTFDLEAWQDSWDKAGGATDDEEDSGSYVSSSTLQIKNKAVTFSPGSTGGSATVPVKELSDQQFTLGAKPGQRLLIAATRLEVQLCIAGSDGKPTPMTGWARCHDIALPASKGGQYTLHFAKAPQGETKDAQLMVDIQ